jgi:hypothetical protein
MVVSVADDNDTQREAHCVFLVVLQVVTESYIQKKTESRRRMKGSSSREQAPFNAGCNIFNGKIKIVNTGVILNTF